MTEQQIDILLENYKMISIFSNKAYSYNESLSVGTYYFTINSVNYQFTLNEELTNGELLFESYISKLYLIQNGEKKKINVIEGTSGTNITLTKGAFVYLNDPAPTSPYGVGKYEQDLDSGRDLDGVMVRNVLDHHPHKIFLNMPYGMNMEQMCRFLNLVDQTTLKVKTFNPWTMGIDITEMEMMHGDLVPEVDYWFYDYETQKIDCAYNSISVEIVEY